MKARVCILALSAALVLAAPLPAVTHAATRDEKKGTARASWAAEQTVPAAPTVTVSICVEAGDVTVRGWERQEVRARAAEAEKIELRRVVAPGDAAAAAVPGSGPASRLEVLALVGEGDASRRAPSGQQQCDLIGNIELDVPRGSTVQIKAPGGDVAVENVAGVRVETRSGEVVLRGITKIVDASSGGGALSLLNSTGGVLLRTISGEIAATDVGPSAPEDKFWAKSTSGEVSLVNVAHAQVSATTATGDISFDGTLARTGRYDLKTHSGDIQLLLAPDASFQLNARVYQGGEIDTEFPIRQLPGSSLGLLRDGRLTGLHGASDQFATLNLSSFDGTLELRRK